MTSSLAVPFPGLPRLDFAFPRCPIKGCIFPASDRSGGLCLLHRRAEEEPDHFLSVQPSARCLDRAKFGLAAPGEERAPGRPRLAAAFRRFRNKVA
jgi:hypothetical protein